MKSTVVHLYSAQPEIRLPENYQSLTFNGGNGETAICQKQFERALCSYRPANV